MSKNRLRQKVDMIFDQVHAHPMHKKLHELPAFLRYLISFFLLIFGIIAFLTPIPGGIIILIVALSLIL